MNSIYYSLMRIVPRRHRKGCTHNWLAIVSSISHALPTGSVCREMLRKAVGNREIDALMTGRRNDSQTAHLKGIMCVLVEAG